MKTRLIILVTLLALSNKITRAQWTFSKIGTDKYISSIGGIDFFSKKYIWVNDNGIRLSKDTGATFTLVSALGNKYLAIMNDSTLLQIKYSNLLKKNKLHISNDYANSWKIYNINDGNDTAFKNALPSYMKMYDEKTGFIFGDDTSSGCQEIWQTVNGLNSWHRVPCKNINIKVYDNIGDKVSLVGGTIFLTNISTKTGTNSNKNIIVGRNYGTYWDTISINKSNILSYTGLAFSDSLNGLFSYLTKNLNDNSTILLRTANGGKTWQETSIEAIRNIEYVKATNNNVGFFVASTTYNKTGMPATKVSFDNGYTWKVLDSMFFNTFKFKDAENGFGITNKDTFDQLAVFTGFPAGFASNKETAKIKPFINIYPNPANELIHLESSERGIYEISNLSGQLMSTGNIIALQPNTISIREFKYGLYFVKFFNSNFCNTFKIIVSE